MKQVIIYTDGACSGNPGPGGWAAILIYQGRFKEFSGSVEETTNNRMELTAAIEGLKKLKERCRVLLYTDSAYIVNCINQRWFEKWEKNGWVTSQKKPVENQDLWQEFLALCRKHVVRVVKVAGHSGNRYNERADKLARSVIKELSRV